MEKGLADVDRCHYVKVAEQLYLFVWREKIIPTLGVVMIDLQGMRTDGKILGYQGSDFSALSNFAVGAHAQVLNTTRHPRDRAMSATYAADAFAGQAVLVTGGAQGIGLAIVSAFARLGAEVTIADVQLPQAQAAAQTLRGEGLSVQALACDLAEPGQIAELVTAVGERHQRLDVVIHNAAYFPLTPFAAIDAALLQRTLSVNLMAPFFLAQAALPWMRRRGGGCLLVTSSVTGPRVAYPGLAHYAASRPG